MTGCSEPLSALHVIPLNDLREHEVKVGCWCHPTEDDTTPDLWIHHALDGRERYETGELKLQ